MAIKLPYPEKNTLLRKSLEFFHDLMLKNNAFLGFFGEKSGQFSAGSFN